MRAQIFTPTQDLTDFCIQTRQALHGIPENAREEFKTQAYVMQALSAMPGWRVAVPCGTAVKAVFEVPQATSCVAFRADMDALNITEQTGLPFASQHKGMMHACGHDGHMAVALGLARAISQGVIQPRATVVILFQPAEESYGGAQLLVEAGALENPHVDEVYGLHIHPCEPLGTIGLREGPLMASTTEVVVDFTGTSSHGALPHLGRDALLAAAHFVTLAQEIPSRVVDPMQPALITFGVLSAGTRRNIVAGHAHVEGIIRCFTPQVAELMIKQITRILQNISQMYEVTYAMEHPTYYPPVNNHPQAVARVRAAAVGFPINETPMQLTAEDFSYYQTVRPGAFYFVGSGFEGAAPIHNGYFDFDNRVLAQGLTVMGNICAGFGE